MMKQFTSATLGFGAGCLGALMVTHFHQPAVTIAPRHHHPIQTIVNPSPTPPTALVAPSFTEAARITVDAVVHVKTIHQHKATDQPWFELFGYEAPSRIAQGSGSGVIIDDRGYIVTNHHVVEAADEVVVSLNNNRSYPAIIVGTDPSTDLAVLKIEADGPVPTVPFGSSKEVRIGEWVLAVGNPFDLASTVTAGIVSAKSRDINILRGNPRTMEYPIESFIQTDAAVNPGNSGGALVNAKGELIGINTAIASRTGSYSGYSFAVPSTIVEKIVQDLLNFGEVRRAYLGIQIEPVTEAIAEELKLERVSGCAITGIIPSSGAAESSLQSGDVVLAIDGTKISDYPELQECIARYHPGDVVSVQYARNGLEFQTTVQLKNRDGSTEFADKKRNPADGNQIWLDDVSAGLSATLPSLSSSLGINGGAQVTSLSAGKFSDSGIRKGFIITKINSDIIKGPQDVEIAFQNNQGGLLVEGMYPNGEKAYYGMAVRP
ncbi:MAG TPA: deoxyribonuclease HsdR [Flavobacteriales bacterium]|nr:deoxyribonuclease HsdR [Flavobacteriales bacterium]